MRPAARTAAISVLRIQNREAALTDGREGRNNGADLGGSTAKSYAAFVKAAFQAGLLAGVLEEAVTASGSKEVAVYPAKVKIKDLRKGLGVLVLNLGGNGEGDLVVTLREVGTAAAAVVRGAGKGVADNRGSA